MVAELGYHGHSEFSNARSYHWWLAVSTRLKFTRLHGIVEDLQVQIGRDTIPALAPFIQPGESIATHLGTVFYNNADTADKLVRFETGIENRLKQQQDIIKSVQE